MQRKIFFEEAPDRLTALPGHALPAWRRLDAWVTTVGPRAPSCLLTPSSILFSGPVSRGTLSTILLESFKHPGPQLNPDRQVDEEIHFNIGSYCPVLPEPLGVKHRGEGQTNTALKRGYIYFLKLSPYDCLQLLPFLRF